tara:strand:+ start:22 stop:1029 length:1008 start_codon:yes stop_codon:yes gene_type:complete
MVDATLQDAEEVVEEEQVDPTVQRPRDKMMEEIVASREMDVLEDMGIETEEEEVEEEIQHEDPKSPVWLKDGNWVTSVKVNGEEVEVPFDGLKTSHQKDAASQQRFEKAAQRERFLAQKEQELRSYAQQLQAHVQEDSPPAQDEEPEQDADYKELVTQYHQALYEDDADKAAELLQTLTTGRTQATPNVEDAVNKALQEAFTRQQVAQARQQQKGYEESVKQAVSWFENEYPDIAGNSELRAIADNKTVTIMKEQPSLAPGNIIHAAAEYAREWAHLNLNGGKGNSARADRKKKIVSEPKPARKTAKIGEDEELEKTPSQVIEEMRKSRGQPINI